MLGCSPLRQQPQRLGTGNRRLDRRQAGRQGKPSKLEEALAKVDLFVLCDHIYQLRKQGDYYFSPIRDDGNNPAFQIRDDGQVCIDHGTADGFNIITLIARVEGLSNSEARKRLLFYADNLGAGDLKRADLRPRETPVQASGRLAYHEWRHLGIGTQDDYLALAELRGLEPVSLITATALDLLYFSSDAGSASRLWTVTDNAWYVRQDRAVSGADIALAGGGTAKTRTIGTASWPVGAANVGAKPVVLLVEGMPDLLAAVQVIMNADRMRDTAPVAMLGAGPRIHPRALAHFAGKRVRIFPHRDDAGGKAAVTWQRQLLGVGAESDFFPYERHIPAGSKPIKDLNDLLVAVPGIATDEFVPNVVLEGGL